MPATVTDRLFGESSSVAVKAPCITVATSNITLSGLQTVNGVSISDGDRVLVTAQSNPIYNGIYNASSSSWIRTGDFDGNRDAVQGTRVLVAIPGAYPASEYELVSANPIIIGTSTITFVLRYGANATYDRTNAEIAASVTPVNYAYPPDYVRRFGAPVDGTTSANAAIALEDLAAIAGNSLPIFSAGTYLVDNNLTITSGAQMLPGAKFSIASGKTLTFAPHAKLVAPETMQIFSGAGSVSFPTDTVAEVYAAWFGFGHKYTGTQNKAALLSAMNALTSGGTIVLPKTGCFIDGDIVPPYSGLLIRGQGWASGYNDTSQYGTTLVASSGTNLFDLTAYFGTANPNEYFTLEGVKIDGASVVNNGLKIMGTKTVRGCLVTGCLNRGIWLAGYLNQTLVEKTTCVSNNSAGGGIGLVAEGSQSTKYVIRDSNFRLNYTGMKISAGLNFSIEDCVFESNVDRGLLETNADGSSMGFGIHLNLWFENNNALAGTRSQYTLATTATTSQWYPQGMQWIGGNINGSSVAGQRCMDIGANCLNTIFSGTRFGAVAADTSSITISAGTNTVFDDCYETVSGQTIDSIAAGSVGNYRQRNNGQALIQQLVTVGYGASMTFDATAGNRFVITANNGTAFTLNAPQNPSIGQTIKITIRNTSGGSLGAATFNAIFKMASWTNPGNGNSRTIEFTYDGTNWVEQGRTASDVPN